MPEFTPNEARVALASMSNPTRKSLTYTAELYLGLPKVVSSGTIPFSLVAGETRNISFPVTMPSVEGSYPVYLDVFSDSQLIGAYQAEEDVVIAAPLPSISIVHFHYVYLGAYTWILTGTMLHGYEINMIGFRLKNNGAYSVDGLSMKCIVNGASLSPLLDQYKQAISQPFTLAPQESIDVFCYWAPYRPGSISQPGWQLFSSTITAEVYVNGELVATRSLDFTISYD